MDLTSNANLTYIHVGNNLLEDLNVQNGNNMAIVDNLFRVTGNPNLNCITVDDEDWSTTNWTIHVEPQTSFSDDCDALSIDEYAFQDLQIFPNPTSDFITISIKESGSYTIVNSLGQKVLNGVLSSTTNQIQLIDLSKGLYFINVSSSLGTMTRKLIVE